LVTCVPSHSVDLRKEGEGEEEMRDRSASPPTELYARVRLPKLSTGSAIFDSLFGGGLPVAAITDVYGAAATGKTQFAFQSAVFTCLSRIASDVKNGAGPVAPDSKTPAVAFVDCAGAFRPERIAEIAADRGSSARTVLDLISSISVRSISEQRLASDRVFAEEKFSRCRLVVVDEVTTNFVAELSGEEEIMERQFLLSNYVRKLAYIANTRGMSVILTNSIRSRGESGESETTGDLLAAYSLFRLRLRREGRTRTATVEGPIYCRNSGTFEIGSSGILP
jgi:RecA/RadA recombinase